MLDVSIGWTRGERRDGRRKCRYFTEEAVITERLMGRNLMKKTGLFLAAALLAASAASSAYAQGTVKIGLIMAYSGQFADTATQMDNAIKLYIKQNGDTVAGKKIELIRKDTGGPNPDVAKRLAQELVVRDKV